MLIFYGIDLRKESRRLENEIDLKLVSFSKLGSTYAHRDDRFVINYIPFCIIDNTLKTMTVNVPIECLLYLHDCTNPSKRINLELLVYQDTNNINVIVQIHGTVLGTVCNIMSLFLSVWRDQLALGMSLTQWP